MMENHRVIDVNTNQSEFILKEEITRQELTKNAEFDSILLYRIWMKYYENKTVMDARILKVAGSKGIVLINEWQ